MLGAKIFPNFPEATTAKLFRSWHCFSGRNSMTKIRKLGAVALAHLMRAGLSSAFPRCSREER